MVVKHAVSGLDPGMRREGVGGDAENELGEGASRPEPVDQRQTIVKADAGNGDERPSRAELGEAQPDEALGVGVGVGLGCGTTTAREPPGENGAQLLGANIPPGRDDRSSDPEKRSCTQRGRG